MKYIRYLVFVLILLTPTIIKAECNYTELAEVRKIASNIQFSYEPYYSIESGIYSEVRFKINMANINSNIYIKDVDKIENYYYNKNIVITKNNYIPGAAYRFEIYSNTEMCQSVLLLTNYVTLPSYNRYAESEVCLGAESYYLCNKWQALNMSYDEFQKKVAEYKKVPEVEEEPVIEIELTTKEKILKFIYNNYYYILAGIITICVTTMFIINAKENKKFK